MIVKIKPAVIKGVIQAPASKSSMQRACAAALINAGTTCIENPGNSNDDLAALEVIQNLGARISWKSERELVVESRGVQPVSSEMDCGESGLGIRMFAPIAALSEQELLINGSGSLRSRPMDFFDEIFPAIGISIRSNAGKLPLTIKGPLQPVAISIDGSLSSQFLTGLLMAYAARAQSPVTITVHNLKSKPYIDLTLQVLKHFGYQVTNNHYESFTVYPASPGRNSNIQYTIEGDWSGAAFLLVAGAVSGNIEVRGLDIFSTQADKAVLGALMDSGCRISINEKYIEVGPPATGVQGLKPFHFDATDCPDLFPPLVALAACCNGTSVISGVSRLAHKESNRGITLQEEFAKMGIAIKLQDDLMLVEGGTGLKGAIVHSRHDHRIAMACAVAALVAEGETCIEEAAAINKSYPAFYNDLQLLGVKLETSTAIEGCK